MIYKDWYIYQHVYLAWIRSRETKKYLNQIAQGEKPLFIHINRTGGSSIAAGLDITAIHYTLEQYEQLWKQRYKTELPLETPVVTAVRNPYDRTVSQYYYRLKHNQNNLSKLGLSFQDWLHEVHIAQNPAFRDREIMFMPQKNWISSKQNYTVSFIRFEQLQQHYQAILGPYGIKPLPHKKASDKPDFQRVLDEESRALIRQVYQEDFNTFSYQS